MFPNDSPKMPVDPMKERLAKKKKRKFEGLRNYMNKPMGSLSELDSAVAE